VAYTSLSISDGITRAERKVQNYTDTWSNLRKTLFSNEDFGQSIKKIKGIDIDKITAGAITEKEKVSKIFEFVRKNIAWNNEQGFFLENPLKKVIESGSGSCSEVNLTLLTLLKMANINAEPMLASTLKHGKLGEQPILRHFNYLLIHTVVDKDSLILDATERDLPMGLLPLRCLNEKAFLLSELPQWISLKPKTKSIENLSFDGVIETDGNLSGTLTVSGSGYYEPSLKKALQENDENIKKQFLQANQQIKNIEVHKSPDKLTLRFSIEDYAKIIDKKIYFSPFCVGKIENLFDSDERKYPINFMIPSEKNLMIKLKIPKDYKIEETPKSNKQFVNENQAISEVKINSTNDTLLINSVFKVNDTIFKKEDYFSLKNLFKFTIEKQSEEVVLSSVK
jgi:hypothetical protein